MSRKKLIKKAKTTLTKVKYTVKTAKLTATEILEKQLKAILAKLPQQCRKELSAAKQQAVKLAAALKKAKAQKKSGTIAKLMAQLEQSKKQVLVLSQKRMKFSEISKTIVVLLKQATSTPSVAKKKAKKTKSVPKAKRTATTLRYEMPKTVTEMTPEFEFENS